MDFDYRERNTGQMEGEKMSRCVEPLKLEGKDACKMLKILFDHLNNIQSECIECADKLRDLMGDQLFGEEEDG